MLSMEQIREDLKDRNLSVVAKRTGVTRAWLSQIRKGADCSATMQKLLSFYLTGTNEKQ